MASQRWRVYLVDMSWEVFHTQYVFFGVSVQVYFLTQVFLRLQKRHGRLSRLMKRKSVNARGYMLRCPLPNQLQCDELFLLGAPNGQRILDLFLPIDF
jgi:hypothetical protein